MNPDFIQTWAEYLQVTRLYQYSPGLLIHLLVLEAPQAEPAISLHLSACHCTACVGGGLFCDLCFQFLCNSPEPFKVEAA